MLQFQDGSQMVVDTPKRAKARMQKELREQVREIRRTKGARVANRYIRAYKATLNPHATHEILEHARQVLKTT